MKHWSIWLLILGMVHVSWAATVSLIPTKDTAVPTGMPGEYYFIADVIVVQIVTDTPLLSLDAIVTGAPIIDAVNVTGDPGFSQDPIINGNETKFTIGGFNGMDNVLAELTIVHPNAPMILTIENDLTWGGTLVLSNFSTPEFMGIYPPEPMSLALLGMGALMVMKRRKS